MATRKSAPKKRKAARAADNGMRTFAMHCTEKAWAPKVKRLETERADVPAFAAPAAATLAEVDAETAATRILNHTLASDSIPDLTAPEADGAKSEFKSLGTETVPLTGTKVVKFRQNYHKIPVYGSLVTVELDEHNEMVSLNSTLGEPKGVNPVATISPAEAVKRVQKHPAYRKELGNTVPRLHYYFDRRRSKWRLVYILENVPVSVAGKKADKTRPAPSDMDYIVDAHTGVVVAELPRTPSLASALETATDVLGKSRRIGVEVNGRRKVLRNAALNVQTFDFEFQDPKERRDRLPGSAINNPPEPWAPAAVSAHANAVAVAEFLRDVLKRNNIDDQGGAIISSINCVIAAESRDGQQWLNAIWNHEQMVYGQRHDGDKLLSLCADLDIVAHEMFHGVTEATARIEYANESGALNESYSDIFGVIIANFNKPDARTWNFAVGEGLFVSGQAVRDLRDPARLGQPAHIDQFRVKPNTREGDFGGVHTNSGIHNRAASLILTTADAAGRPVLTPKEVAAIFYLALTQQLSRTSGFGDSRRGVLLAARSLFRKLTRAQQDKKVKAIEKAFNAVGIEDS